MQRGARRLAIPFVCALLLVLGACGGSSGSGGTTSSQPVTLNVFAAASLKDAFGDVKAAFEKTHAGVTVEYNFGGSDTLATQIHQGASADVFASANIKQMNVVVSAGDVAPSAPRVFAHNTLVVVYPKGNPANIQTLQDLAKPGLKLVLAANTVPAGQYAVDFLGRASADASFGAGFKDAVLKNVLSYETDVRSVLNKVTLGEADAGIVYVTDAKTVQAQVGTITIPSALQTAASYPASALKGSPHADLAQAFVDYLLSTGGQATLTKYGFLPGANGPQYTPPGA